MSKGEVQKNIHLHSLVSHLPTPNWLGTIFQVVVSKHTFPIVFQNPRSLQTMVDAALMELAFGHSSSDDADNGEGHVEQTGPSEIGDKEHCHSFSTVFRTIRSTIVPGLIQVCTSMGCSGVFSFTLWNHTRCSAFLKKDAVSPWSYVLQVLCVVSTIKQLDWLPRVPASRSSMFGSLNSSRHAAI